MMSVDLFITLEKIKSIKLKIKPINVNNKRMDISLMNLFFNLNLINIPLPP